MDIFVPDIFSRSKPLFSSVSEATREAVLDVARKGFGHLGDMTTVSQSGGQEINSSNFKLVLGVDQYVLKRVRAAPPKARQLNTQAAISETLRQGGVPMPVFEKTKSGDFCHRRGSDVWFAQQFVEGDYFSGSSDEAESTADVMNELSERCMAIAASIEHIDPAPFVDLGESNPAWRVLDRPSDFAESLKPANVALLEQHRGRIIALRSALRKNGALASQDTQLCHIDLHPHNLLTRGSKVVAVLDFESLKPAPRRTLFAYGCYKLLRQVGVVTGAERETRMSRFRASLRMDRLLGTQVPQVHADFAAAEVMRRLCIVLGLNATRGDTTWNHMLEVMIRAMHELPYVFGVGDLP
jgi:aminoglycoside phosphotransferase (APT) family kinase protein